MTHIFVYVSNTVIYKMCTFHVSTFCWCKQSLLLHPLQLYFILLDLSSSQIQLEFQVSNGVMTFLTSPNFRSTFCVTGVLQLNFLVHTPKTVNSLKLINHAFADLTTYFWSGVVPQLIKFARLHLFNSNCGRQQKLLPYSIYATLFVHLTSLPTRAYGNLRAFAWWANSYKSSQH